MYEKCTGFFKAITRFIKRIALQKHITSKQISRMPLFEYAGTTVVVDDEKCAEDNANELRNERIVGFDTESRPAFTKGEYYPPSIVQIASSSKVYIFKLANIGGIRPLTPVFQDEKIVKVGAAISNDIKKLQSIENFNACGFYDLGMFSKKLNIQYTGLRTLAAIFLRIRISKSSRLTDWSNESLTSEQINYAATDAWVSREVFMEMLKYL